MDTKRFRLRPTDGMRRSSENWGDSMKSIVKVLARVGQVLLYVASGAFSIFCFYCFHLMVEGKFDWNMPYAVPKAFGATVAILLIALAAYSFREKHRREYGVQQVIVGCLVLMAQFGEPESSGGFAVRFLLAVFFLVQGIDNINHKAPVRP
jgi:hypothetical protein